MKAITAVMCHNIAKYNREHQEPEMTPHEVAEKLEFVYSSCSEKYSRRALDAPRDTDFEYYLQAVRCAASYLHKIDMLKRALELACRKIAEYLGYENLESAAGVNSIAAGAEALMEIYIQQAQEKVEKQLCETGITAG